MASPEVFQVHPLSEMRAQLSGILARFRREGAAAEPIAFGSHRKPEAILIPYEAYERYEALARQRARLDDALSAAQSVQVELPGAFSPEHDREVSAYVDGEITAAELYRRTVARYRLTYDLGEANAIHSFREGNGRAQRAFFEQIASDCGFILAWQHLDADRNNH